MAVFIYPYVCFAANPDTSFIIFHKGMDVGCFSRDRNLFQMFVLLLNAENALIIDTHPDITFAVHHQTTGEDHLLAHQTTE